MELGILRMVARWATKQKTNPHGRREWRAANSELARAASAVLVAAGEEEFREGSLVAEEIDVPRVKRAAVELRRAYRDLHYLYWTETRKMHEHGSSTEKYFLWKSDSMRQ